VFNLNDLMSQLQQTQSKLQEQMQKQQETMERTEVMGQAGGGLVKVYVNGRFAARRVEVDRNLLRDDPEMMEDLIAAAFNDAANKINDLREKSMQNMGQGLGLPPGMNIPGFKLPF
jgi:nucleoid-associated protein EbfC